MKSLLREDRKAKTKAYFFKKTEVVFNRKIINFLEKYYKKNLHFTLIIVIYTC